jgi:hypothetical protein
MEAKEALLRIGQFIRDMAELIDEEDTNKNVPAIEIRKKRHWKVKAKECTYCGKLVKNYGLHFKLAHDPNARREALVRLKEMRSKINRSGL